MDTLDENGSTTESTSFYFRFSVSLRNFRSLRLLVCCSSPLDGIVVEGLLGDA